MIYDLTYIKKHVPNKDRASIRTKLITVSQPLVFTKKDVNSDSNGLSSKGIDNTKTRRPQPRSNTKNDRANVSIKEKQKKQQPKVKKTKKVGFIERLATPKPSKPRFFLRWLPTGRLFDLKGKIIASSESESQPDCSNGDNACASNHLEPKIKRFPNSTSLLGSVIGKSDVIVALGFQNPCYLKRAQQLKPKLYDGSVIEKYDAIVVHDSEETLLLAEESRSKMIEKQNDPKMAEKKVITKPIDYAVLNQLLKDFETRFVPQTELLAKQAFWSSYSVQPKEPNLSASTTIVEVLKELPKVSLVNSSLKKLKFYLASFDTVVKERTTATAITEGTWGFEHTKACFRDDVILFVKALKELFNSFDQFLIDELGEVEQVFKQMEQAIEQHSVEKNKFKNKMKNVLQENDRLLTQVLSVDIMNIIVHDNVKSACMDVDVCERCVTIESELKKDFIKKNF
nr:hypothetical protein [Tanacetum cinerariifolium]